MNGWTTLGRTDLLRRQIVSVDKSYKCSYLSLVTVSITALVPGHTKGGGSLKTNL